MDADAVLQVSAQHAIWIGIPQVGFAEEGKLTDVIHAFDVIRCEAFLLHQMAVVRDVLPDMADLSENLFILDLQDFFPWSRFDFRLIILLCEGPVHVECVLFKVSDGHL